MFRVKTRQSISFLICAGILATSSGCAALAVLGLAAGGIAYAKGDLERTYAHPIDVVYAASLSAVGEMQLQSGYEAMDRLKARIERHTATGDRVRIDLTSRGSFTNLDLRVNTFGDKGLSLALLQKIEQHLPSPQPISGPVLHPVAE